MIICMDCQLEAHRGVSDCPICHNTRTSTCTNAQHHNLHYNEHSRHVHALHQLVPVNKGWNARQRALKQLLLTRAPAVLKLVFNILMYWEKLGPCDNLDCFLTPGETALMAKWIWLGLYQVNAQSQVLNWCAAIPFHLLRILTNVWSLNMDIFSDVFNNGYVNFCCDPNSKFAFLAPQVDAFKAMTQLEKVDALCNPPFSQTVIARYLAAVETRCMQHLHTNVVYVGPEHQDLFKLHEAGWADKLADFPAGSLPFVHAWRGTLRGFPRPLQLWHLGNSEWPPTAGIVRSLIFLRQRFPLTIAPHIYEHAPARMTRKLLMNQQWEQLRKLQQRYKDRLTASGRLDWGPIHHLHHEVKQAATFLPIFHELQWRWGTLPDVDLLASECSSIYIIVCCCCNLVYIGSTIRAPWTRFKEELMNARRAAHFPLEKTWRRRLSLTDHLLLHGLDKAIFVVVESWPEIHESWLRHREFEVMRMFPRERLLNIKVPHSSRVIMHTGTMNICRQGIMHILSAQTFQPLLLAMQRFGIRELANKIVTSQRVVYDARTLLLLYKHMTDFFTPEAGIMVHFKRCMLRRLRCMGLRLPLHLTFRVRQMVAREKLQITSHLKQFIASLPLQPLLKFYYQSILNVVRTQARSLGDSLYNFKNVLMRCTGHLLQHVCAMPVEQCSCTKLGSALPRVNGHVCFRPLDLDDSQDIGILTQPMIQALRQPMKGTPQMTASQRWKLLKPELKQLRKNIPTGTTDMNVLYGQLRRILERSAIDVRGDTTVRQAKMALKRLNCCCCGPLDKNPNAIWVSCNTLYLQLLYQKFLGPDGIGGFQMMSSVAEAATQLHTAITQHDQHFHVSRGNMKYLQAHSGECIPTFYMLFKNKMFPVSNDTIKLRPITSHFKHPFKRWASKCTRGLSVMLKLAVATLGSTVSLHCPSMMDSMTFWKHGTQHLGHSTSMRLFEYDIADMYYHIPKEKCLILLTRFFQLFRDKFKRRSVAINKGCRKLDRIGCGSSELYTTIPISELFEYGKFELLSNIHGRVGLLCFQQTVGIPMGGYPSGIIANIYLFMREIETHATFLTRDFFVFRYMDNLPGIYDITKTTLTDIHSILTYIYDMPLKLEQQGMVLDSLELRLVMQEKGLLFYHKPLLRECFLHFLPQCEVERSISRLPPVWCSNFRSFLKLYVHSVLLKCLRFGSDLFGVVIGIINLLKGLQVQGISITKLFFMFKQFCARFSVPSYLEMYIGYLLKTPSDLFPT